MGNTTKMCVYGFVFDLIQNKSLVFTLLPKTIKYYPFFFFFKFFILINLVELLYFNLNYAFYFYIFLK